VKNEKKPEAFVKAREQGVVRERSVVAEEQLRAEKGWGGIGQGQNRRKA